MATAPAEPGAAAGGEPLCPRCGARYDGEQEYCLECGLRLPETRGVAGALAAAWVRRLGGYPGDWIWPVLLFLVIAIAGAVVAVLLSRTTGSGKPLVATNNRPVTPPTVVDTSGTVTPPASTVVSPPVTATTAPPATTGTVPRPRPRPAGPIKWPAGRSGYSVVLESIPRTPEGRKLALARAREGIRAGLARVGILDSNNFSSLHPGYYVVFSGIYSDKGRADAAVSRGRAAGFSAAYSRRIVP